MIILSSIVEQSSMDNKILGYTPGRPSIQFVLKPPTMLRFFPSVTSDFIVTKRKWYTKRDIIHEE